MKAFPGPLIRDDVDSNDKTYQWLLRDHPKARADRDFVESLWAEYWPYADDDFYRDVPRDFISRFWEMDLACGLIRLGLPIERRCAHGPDICTNVEGRRVWIEAVAPKNGDGPDAASDLVYDMVARDFVDEEAILLRLRSGIEEKARKYQGYRAAGIIAPDEPYIIGVNGCRVSAAIIEHGVPYIVKAVYALGDSAWRFDLATERVTELPPAHRPAIEKANKALVATTCFLDEEYRGITGVLYSRADASNRRDDWRFVHSMVGANRLPRGWLKTGKEYWPEQGGLEITRHSGSDD